jgi:hypothetical protein
MIAMHETYRNEYVSFHSLRSNKLVVTSFYQTIFTLMILGAIGALVFQVLKTALGCLVIGIVTFVILALIYGVLHLFGLAA